MRVPILMYHSVSEAANDAFAPFAVRPAEFARQIAHIADRGMTTLTVADLVARRASGQVIPARSVVITFDDGFSDFMTEALPVLVAHGAVATQYVVSDLVGGTSGWLADVGEGHRPLMDGPAMREADAAGIEIGAHTRTHPRLDDLAPQRAQDEIEGSKSRIEDLIGRAVTTFAYPYGLYHAGTVAAVRRAGFAGACAVRYRTSPPDDDQFALARLIVRRGIRDDAFAALLQGNDSTPGMAVDRLRAWGWRSLRALRRGMSKP
jgi:peptidoglycan/xylan/chitin deacetylase (PgdA/CDA1 family)